MLNHPSTEQNTVWTVAEAKAKLSELLRRANETPQYIGTKQPYVIIPAEQWEKLNAPTKPLGQWLIENMKNIEELELPNRKDPERETPFH